VELSGMKNGFHSRGELAYESAREDELWKIVRLKYKRELASTAALKRPGVLIKMYREYLHFKKDSHHPSPHTLW
jgi:hypothetical protein